MSNPSHKLWINDSTSNLPHRAIYDTSEYADEHVEPKYIALQDDSDLSREPFSNPGHDGSDTIRNALQHLLIPHETQNVQSACSIKLRRPYLPSLPYQKPLTADWRHMATNGLTKPLDVIRLNRFETIMRMVKELAPTGLYCQVQ